MEPIAVPSGLYLIGLKFCLKNSKNIGFFKQNDVNFVKILRGIQILLNSQNPKILKSEEIKYFTFKIK